MAEARIIELWEHLSKGSAPLVWHGSKHYWLGKAFWRNEKTASVSIRPDRGEDGRFYDFGTGEKGGPVGLIALAKFGSSTSPEALRQAGRWLRANYGLPGQTYPQIDRAEAERAQTWRVGMLEHAQEKLVALKQPISEGLDINEAEASKIRKWTAYEAHLHETTANPGVIAAYREHMRLQPEWAEYICDVGAVAQKEQRMLAELVIQGVKEGLSPEAHAICDLIERGGAKPVVAEEELRVRQ